MRNRGQTDPEDRWLRRDYTGYTRTPLEAAWLGELRRVLKEVQPPQVAPAETALTSEGPGLLIALIPHRSLGGLTIVVTLRDAPIVRPGERGVLIGWAQVGDLAYHDELDDAVSVAEIALSDPPDASFEEASEALRRELSRPLVLRIWSSGPAECYLWDGGPVVARLGSWPRWPRRKPALGRDEYADAEVSFTDPHPPPIVEASGAMQWFRHVGSGA